MLFGSRKLQLRFAKPLYGVKKLGFLAVETYLQTKAGKNCPSAKNKGTGSWNWKVWYTLTLWEKETEINAFYRNGSLFEM